MHMRNMERRVHLLLDEPRYRKVAEQAERRGVSVAAVIRDAIDRLPGDELRREGIAEVLAAFPMEVPLDPSEIRRELDRAHDWTG